MVLPDARVPLVYFNNANLKTKTRPESTERRSFPQGITDPIDIIATISEQPFGYRKVIEQGSGAAQMADLACGHEEAARAANVICHGIKPFEKLRRALCSCAFCAPKQTPRPISS